MQRLVDKALYGHAYSYIKMSDIDLPARSTAGIEEGLTFGATCLPDTQKQRRLRSSRTVDTAGVQVL
jgi:hypothetical protein